jgi:lipopolysaccharide/colanic/teichoic acid biosynthesis glycosyltransferase
MSKHLGPNGIQRLVKRGIDFAAALAGIVVLFPVMMVVAVCIGWRMGRPILFRQVRAGLAERAFSIFKFRTMNNACDAAGNLLPDSDRVTRLGRFLRRTSLDELPQLWNVLRGELSLVGPRPLPVRYLPRYTPRQALRHRVKPGITGLAQIRGRTDLDWDTKLELDVQYAENYSLWLDWKIFCITLVKVLRRSGTGSAENCPEFRGSTAENSKLPLPPGAGHSQFPLPPGEG